MRVLGIDPGLSRCGVGVVERRGQKTAVVRAGVVRTDAGRAVGQRLQMVHAALTDVLAATRPDAVAVERVFFNANVRTAMGVGQAAGIALLCAAEADLPVTEYTPTQVKAAIAGTGDADKQQMTFMVRALLGLAEPPRPADTADALALALCHLRRLPPHRPSGGAESREMTAGTWSPRLAAAWETSSAGAQIVQRGRKETL